MPGTHVGGRAGPMRTVPDGPPDQGGRGTPLCTRCRAVQVSVPGPDAPLSREDSGRVSASPEGTSPCPPVKGLRALVMVLFGGSWTRHPRAPDWAYGGPSHRGPAGREGHRVAGGRCVLTVGKELLSQGYGHTAPASPCPGAGSAPSLSRRAAPWGPLACLLPTRHPAGRRPRSPSTQAPAGHPQEASGPSQGWGAVESHLGQKENKTRIRPQPPAHTPSLLICSGACCNLLPGAVGKCDGEIVVRRGLSGPVGQVWFLPGVEGRTWPEVTA